ncbi:MAG: HEPN domain-containing protein [Actinobacteria bacterium]|nr:HEPN domain-containing protein [Actinomycetota bacterium]
MTDYVRDLSAHRLKKAKDVLRQADLLLKNAEYDGSINRSYYAIFNSIRALLALIGVDSRKHSGVISCFDRYFVKTGYLDKQFSKIAHNAFDVRQVSDYQDFQMPTCEQAKEQYDDAERFIAEIARIRGLFIRGALSLPTISLEGL